MRARLIALAVLLSCAQPPLAFTVDESFPASARSDIERATEWNGLTYPENRITTTGGEWLLLRGNPGAPTWNGFCSLSHRAITLRVPVVGVTTLYQSAKHEFGHALGLRHPCSFAGIEGPTSNGRECIPGRSLGVMDPIAGDSVFSDYDLEECRTVGACPP